MREVKAIGLVLSNIGPNRLPCVARQNSEGLPHVNEKCSEDQDFPITTFVLR